MTLRLNLLHKVVGIATVLIFIGTGLLLRFHFTRVYEANHVVRMMFRSIHIYILLSGLLNIATGTYLILSDRSWRRAAQAFGSICLLLSPAILIFAFFYEPVRESLERPVTLLGIVLLLIGTLSHLLSAWRVRVM